MNWGTRDTLPQSGHVAVDRPSGSGTMNSVVKRLSITLRHPLVVAIAALVLIGGVGAGVLAEQQSSQGSIGGQRNVVPHLVPDTGGLHARSQGSTSAPKAAPQSGIRLIPSAGAPVRAYGGSPGGATFVPAKHLK